MKALEIAEALKEGFVCIFRNKNLPGKGNSFYI